MFKKGFPGIDDIPNDLLPISLNLDEWQKCKTSAERVNILLNSEWKNDSREIVNLKSAKNDTRSVEIRETGNSQFRDKKYLEALQSYTASIACAKSITTASLAYGNRSAVLARFGLYEECLIDIERAFKHDYPEKLNPKLLHRQKEVQGLLLLQRNGKTLPKTEIGLEERNPLIQSATNSIKIGNNEKYGRHIVAVKNIKIGELLVVEEPYVVSLNKDFLLRCHQCIARCYNLIPCDNCTEAMYCTETCKQEAYQHYHKYECLISYHLPENFPPWKMIFKTILTEKKESVEEEKHSIYRSDRFDEISQLLIHLDKCPPKFRLGSYFMTAVIFTVLKEKTTFFEDFVGFEETFKESFVLNSLRWHLNGIPISKKEVDDNFVNEEEFAGGLYSLSSLFNHSCYPNTFFYFEGSKIILRALASIKKGEQCFISYGPLYHKDPKPFRTETMQTSFFFTCECRACEENWPAIGELHENVSYISPLRSLQGDQMYLEVFLLMLAALEDSAPSAQTNYARGVVRDLHSGYEILPQAL